MASTSSSRNTRRPNDTPTLLPDTYTRLSHLYKEHHVIYRAIEAGDNHVGEAAAYAHVASSNTSIGGLLTAIRRQRAAAVR